MKKYIIIISLILFAIQMNSQSFYDLEKIQSIEVNFGSSNWDALMDAQKAGNEEYILAQSISINGVTFDSVGVKYKGNSTYNANQVKNPWHIELDTYKEQDYQGYTDIKLSNVQKDPSFLREVLSYDIIGRYMDCPLSNYANLTVNGNLIGLYSNSESISKKFVQSRFNSKSNTFIKCNPINGAGPQSSDLPNLVYLGQDSSAYYEAYELKSDYGWQKLIDLCDTLSNHSDQIENILNVNRALWMLALNNVLVNLDSYIGQFAQNYYLYESDYGKFNPIIWDLNESFGVFSLTGSGGPLQNTTSKQRLSPFSNAENSNFPLLQNLLDNPTYRRMYVAHMKTILVENFENDYYADRAMVMHELISDKVSDDPNKFYSFNNFNNNLNNDVNVGGGPMGGSIPGIINLMEGRTDYLLNLSEFISESPTILNIETNPNPSLLEDINFTCQSNNSNSVFLYYRFDSYTPFQKIEMFDDGLHNDEQQNDGIYGAGVELSGPSMQYYIYSENSEAGIFSPRRAEHEFHTLSAENIAGDLVINELLASNDDGQTDQDGENDDWIELYNNSEASIDITGYTLSDDINDLAKWEFPIGTSIPANDFLIIWADNDSDQDGLHANFKLSKDGESLFLSNQNEELVDNVTFEGQDSDVSYGRFPNGTGDFGKMNPTYNSENSVFTSLKEGVTPHISIFPNPVSYELNIEAYKNIDEIQIFNINGQLIYTKKQQSNSIAVDFSVMEKGLYIVRIKTEQDWQSRRIIKID